MDIFEIVKENADILTAAEMYGLKVRNRQCMCPLHEDKHPSMHIYENNFHCFSCGVHGDVIKLAEILFDMSPIESAKKIASDFGIIIPNTSISEIKAKVNKAQKKKAEREAYKEKERQAFILMNRYVRLLEYYIHTYAPLSPLQDKCDERFSMAINELEQCRYYLDVLTNGEENDIKEIMENNTELYAKIKNTLAAFYVA